jgi:hypothetical protein
MGKMFRLMVQIIGRAATTRLRSGFGGLHISPSVINFCLKPDSGPKFTRFQDVIWSLHFTVDTVEFRSLNSFYFIGDSVLEHENYLSMSNVGHGQSRCTQRSWVETDVGKAEICWKTGILEQNLG